MSDTNNNTGNQVHVSDELAPKFIVCSDCGHEVPEMNMTIHQLRACKGRARRPSEKPEDDEFPQPMDVDGISPKNEEPTLSTVAVLETNNDINVPSSDGGVKTGDDDDIKDEAHVLDHSEDETTQLTTASRIRSVPEEATTTPQNGLRRRRRRILPHPQTLNALPIEESSSSSNNDILQVSDVVDLLDSPQSGNEDEEWDVVDLAESPQTDAKEEEEWACPQCTLLNPKSAPACDACQYSNPNRPPDPTRRERLIPVENYDESFASMSPLAIVSGGALLGGVLGAAGSYMRGLDPLSGAAEGAMTGVVGGSFLQEVLRSPVSISSNISENRNPNIAQARSSAAVSGGYPSMSDNNHRGNSSNNRRAQPRSSFRVVREQTQDGMTTTIVTGGNGTTRITRRSLGSPQGINDPMLSLLLHSYLVNEGGGRGGLMVGGHPNIDGMDYEALLQAFGDGTENLGADEHRIQQLPTKVLTDPTKELPEDARQCLICLEDFEAGERRKTLPCLHGFHQTCADKWLRTNGSCPICKHRLPT